MTYFYSIGFSNPLLKRCCSFTCIHEYISTYIHMMVLREEKPQFYNILCEFYLKLKDIFQLYFCTLLLSFDDILIVSIHFLQFFY